MGELERVDGIISKSGRLGIGSGNQYGEKRKAQRRDMGKLQGKLTRNMESSPGKYIYFGNKVREWGIWRLRS